MRAVSTVLDVSLCLLFVTASALTLVGTPLVDRSSPEAGPDSADEAAEVLTTTTASVTYGSGDRNRTAHDTLSGLLASAVLADTDSASAIEFRSAVTSRVGRALRDLDVDAQVVADPVAESRPAPVPESPLTVGTEPPSNADVHAATVAVRGARLTVRTWSR